MWGPRTHCVSRAFACLVRPRDLAGTHPYRGRGRARGHCAPRRQTYRLSSMSVAIRLATRRAMSSCSSTTTVWMRSREVAWSDETRESPRNAVRSRAPYPAPTSSWAPATGCVIRVPTLRREGAAAAAAARRVRILEGEAGALHRRGIIDDDAADVLRREGVHEHPVAFLLDDEVVLGRGIFDEQAVLEAAAPTGLDAYAKPTDGGVHAFLGHELLDLDACYGREGHENFRGIDGAHWSSSGSNRREGLRRSVSKYIPFGGDSFKKPCPGRFQRL